MRGQNRTSEVEQAQRVIMSFLDHPKRLGRLNLIAQLSFRGALLFSICKWSHEVKIPAPGSGLAQLVLRWPSFFQEWGCSSVGRAVALQAIGQEFESPQLHQPSARLQCPAVQCSDIPASRRACRAEARSA